MSMRVYRRAPFLVVSNAASCQSAPATEPYSEREIPVALRRTKLSDSTSFKRVVHPDSLPSIDSLPI
jgi:hypothetical protein